LIYQTADAMFLLMRSLLLLFLQSNDRVDAVNFLRAGRHLCLRA